VLTAPLAQVGKNATLYDREQVLRITIFVGCRMEVGPATVEPPVRQLHRPFGIAALTRVRRTFVKGHNDIAAYCALDIHHLLRCKEVLRSVDMRLENDALLLYFSGTR